MASFEIGYVYILQLENGKFYVGFTKKLSLRLYQHWAGKGSKWTHLHKPLHAIVSFSHGDTKLESQITKEMMLLYGWENVRGSGWSQINMNEPKTKVNHFNYLISVARYLPPVIVTPLVKCAGL